MDQNPYIKYFYKKVLPSVKTKQVIYVPKLLEPLTIPDLAHKVIKIKDAVDSSFVIKQKKYDGSYF